MFVKNAKLTYTASFVCVLLTMHTNLVFCGLYIIFFLHVFYFIFVMDLKTGKENKKKLQKDIILDTLSPISLQCSTLNSSLHQNTTTEHHKHE